MWANFPFCQIIFEKICISKTRNDTNLKLHHQLQNQHKLKKIFSFNSIYFTKNNENLFEKINDAIVNGMKNHKKIGIRLFAANHIQVSRLVKQSYRFELSLTGEINQVSGINTWTYTRKQ